MTKDVEFNDELRNRLTHNLEKHSVRAHPRHGRIRAAVSVIVVDGDLTGRGDRTASGAAILLTRRTKQLKRHAGQWALPGGRVDPGETALDAAIRETREEIGVQLEVEQLLGRLDDYPTRSGFVITPFVFWAGNDAEPTPNPEEVASVHRIALQELLRPDSPRFITISESDRPVIQIPVGDELITHLQAR